MTASAVSIRHTAITASVVGTILLLSTMASSGTAGTGRPKCHGEPATQVGTPGDDRIVVTRNNAVVKARGGNDKIEVYGDSATVCGGKGGDGIGAFPRAGGHGMFLANRGRDCLGKPECTKDRTQGAGSTRCTHYSVKVELDGGPGPDTMWGGNRGDTLHGGGGRDVELHGCWGGDRVKGGSGDDYVVGLEGDDHLKGGAGDDFVAGREGDDRLKGGAGDDFAAGGTGHDHCEAEGKRGCET